MSDLKEGKITLPILYLLKEASPADRLFLQQEIASRDISSKSLDAIQSLVRQYETALRTVQVANELTHEALSILRSRFSESPERQALETLAEALLFRTQ
jgi:geranylgeranyl pyrophosphate synthase